MRFLFCFIILVNTGFAFDKCGSYALEGEFQKDMFVYHKGTTSEIRFKIMNKDLIPKKTKRSWVQLKISKLCKYDCEGEIELTKPLNFDEGSTPKIEKLHPILEIACK